MLERSASYWKPSTPWWRSILHPRAGRVVLDSQTQTISLIRQDQRGTQLFLAPDLGKVALVAQHVTNPLAASSEVPLPLRVGGIGDRLARGDRRAFVEGGERPGAIALPAQHVANRSMTYGEVALPQFVAWIGRDEAEANGSPSQNGGKGVSWRFPQRRTELNELPDVAGLPPFCNGLLASGDLRPTHSVTRAA